MVKIKILGTGCPRCKQLERNVNLAVEELELDAEVKKVTNIKQFADYGIMMTPGLVVDGEVKSQGKDLSIEDVKLILKD